MALHFVYVLYCVYWALGLLYVIRTTLLAEPNVLLGPPIDTTILDCINYNASVMVINKV